MWHSVRHSFIHTKTNIQTINNFTKLLSEINIYHQIQLECVYFKVGFVTQRTKMCDIQGCSEFSLFDLGEEDSVEISRKKGYPVKKLCKSHHYFLAKSGKKKKEEHCCDSRRIHGSKAKSKYTVEEDFCLL